MTTIELFQKPLDTSGYEQEVALVYYIPGLILLAFALYVIIAHIGGLISAYRNKEPKHSFDADASHTKSFLQVHVGLALILTTLISFAFVDWVRNTPHGENDVVDAVSYVPFDGDGSSDSTIKAQTLDDLKESIADKKDVLEKYGLTDEVCEDHNRRTEETSVLCGGVALTDVGTPTHKLHVTVGNDTEIIKDAEPEDKISTHDTLVWASVIAKENE